MRKRKLGKKPKKKQDHVLAKDPAKRGWRPCLRCPDSALFWSRNAAHRICSRCRDSFEKDRKIRTLNSTIWDGGRAYHVMDE